MAVIRKVSNFLEKFDEFIVAGLLIPVGQKILDVFMEKGAKKIGERVEKILGFNIEEAKHDITDEILYSNVVYRLLGTQSEEIDAFEERLRQEDCSKAEALVLYIAKTVKQFERNVKEAVNPKKGESGPRVEQEYKKLEEGIESAKKFLEALLKKTGATPSATFQARVSFLQGKNVFSLIPGKKCSPPINDLTNKAYTYVKTKQSANLTDLERKSESFLERSRRFRERRGR